MGKVFNYITMLVFIDLFFIITGQALTAGSSLGSIIINAILDINNIFTLSFFNVIMGDFFSLFTSGAGIASLLASGGVIAVAVVTKDADIKYIPMALTFALLAGDFVFIAVYLTGLNAVLGTLLMAPIIIMYLIAILEWMKNKD